MVRAKQRSINHPEITVQKSPGSSVRDALGRLSASDRRALHLKPRTRSHYRALLDNQLKTWNDVPVKDIRPEAVRDWHAALSTATPTTRAHAYGLLRAILATAVSDSLLPVNPCHIRGAGTSKRVKKIRPATLEGPPYPQVRRLQCRSEAQPDLRVDTDSNPVSPTT